MTKRDGIGVCRICGKAKELSFEHIPPRSLSNNGPSKMYRATDIVEAYGAFNSSKTEGVRYRQQQRGTGFQALCRDCNSYLGRNYVSEYAKCVKELGGMLVLVSAVLTIIGGAYCYDARTPREPAWPREPGCAVGGRTRAQGPAWSVLAGCRATASLGIWPCFAGRAGYGTMQPMGSLR